MTMTPDEIYQTRIKLRQRIEAALGARYPIERLLGVADDWALSRAAERVAVERETAYQEGYAAALNEHRPMQEPEI